MPPERGFSKSSLAKVTKGMAGHAKGLSMGITEGSTSHVRILKAIIMDGLSCGLG